VADGPIQDTYGIKAKMSDLSALHMLRHQGLTVSIDTAIALRYSYLSYPLCLKNSSSLAFHPVVENDSEYRLAFSRILRKSAMKSMRGFPRKVLILREVPFSD
jgi:hypothetical protein